MNEPNTRNKKRNLTPEQIAARDERRAKMRSVAAQISKMNPEQRAALAAKCPIVTIEGHALSAFNMCLLMMQNPTATVVGGFRQWKKAGRSVTKGEHGAGIWCPIGTKSTDANGETHTEMDEKKFVFGTVFDISQTQPIQESESEAA